MHSSDELYGSDRVLLDVLTSLDPTKITPVVVLPSDVPGGGGLSARLRDAGIEVHTRQLAVLRRRYFTVPGALLLAWRTLMDIIWLGRLARRRSVSCVYSNTMAVQSGALVAAVLGIRHVWHVHEIIERPKIAKRLLRFSLLRLSAEIIVVSNAVAKWVASDRVPVHVVHNGIDARLQPAGPTADYRQQLLASRAGPLIGWVGRLSPWKGYELFTSFAQQAARDSEDLAFVIAGGAPAGTNGVADALRQRIASGPAPSQITYLGEIADGRRLIAALDLLVACPTQPDPFPRVVQEALIEGVPVMAVRTGGLPELIVDGVTGAIIDAAKCAALTEGMRQLLAPGRLRTLGAAARDDALERFAMDAFVTRIQGIMLAEL